MKYIRIWEFVLTQRNKSFHLTNQVTDSMIEESARDINRLYTTCVHQYGPIPHCN